MKRYATLPLLLGLLLAACGPSEADIQATVAVAETNAVSAAYTHLTETALANPTATPSPSPTFTLMPTNTPIVTATLSTGGAGTTGGATSTCDVMTFVSDVTVSDGEEISAGTPFTKTWAVRNDGTCDWSTAYQVIYSSGDQMGGASATTLSAAIAVGGSGNISVELTAPAESGEYTGYWALANAAGQAFGFLSVVITVP
jgi:hypothetical protein